MVWSIESSRLDDEIQGQVTQEFTELAAMQERGLDPATGEPFPDVTAMLRSYLERKVPPDCQVVIGWVDEGPTPYVAGADLDGSDVGATLLDQDAFTQVADRVAATGGHQELTLPSTGPLMVDAQPVRQGGTRGALVVVTYLDEERQGLVDTMRTYLLVALVTLASVTLLAARQSGRLLAPLRTLRETADEIGETDLSRRIAESGNDDITALTRTLNRMLGRLETAFAGQREFLDDAGHELRTPLTVIRGHLEVLDASDSADVEETRALLLDEVDRMSRLVGDLTLLTKSTRPDFLTVRPTDLGRLTDTLLSKAGVLGDREWVLDARAEAEVGLDEQRITQAVLQLVDNAVKHTRDGDVVALGSSYAPGVGGPGEVRLWVRDSGAGVAPEDRELVFERFGRSAVPDHDEGFGLGLSIVAAIASAHGGRVHVEDAPGGGALVVLTLPEVS